MRDAMMERVVRRLLAKYTVDHEVMEDSDKAALIEEIAWCITNSLAGHVAYVGCYCQGHDLTFVQRELYLNGEIVMATCVGWYHGEPSDEATKHFSNNKLTAVYDL